MAHRAPKPSVRDRVGLDGRTSKLVAASLVDSTGTGLYLAGSAVFFTRAVGLHPAQVGFGLAVAGAVGLVALIPLGWLADQIGPRRLLVCMHVFRAAGFVSYAFVHGFWQFLVVVALLGVPEQAVYPVTQAMVERIVGAETRLRTLALVRSVFNVGFTIGAGLAAVALKFDTRLAYDTIMVGDAVTFIGAAALLLRIPMPRQRDAQRLRLSKFRLVALRDLRYVAVAGVNAVMAMHMSILAVGIPLWVTLHTTAPRWVVGPLLVVNTVLTVLFQVRASRGADDARGGVRVMRRASLALCLACVLLGFASQVSTVPALLLLAAGIAAETVGELSQSAAGWGLSYALAPTVARAEYLATFGLSISLQYMLGPVIVTVAVVDQGTVGWLALGVAFLAFGALAGPVVNAADRRSMAGTATASVRA